MADTMRPSPATLMKFNGTWRKDKDKSDSLDPASDLLQLSSTVRGVLPRVGPMIIQSDEQAFKSVLKMPKLVGLIPLPAVKEEFPWSGEEREHNRRDNRSGKFKGCIEPCRFEEGFKIKAEWASPLPGRNIDTYKLSPDGNTLILEQNLTVEGKNLVYKTVYIRDK